MKRTKLIVTLSLFQWYYHYTARRGWLSKKFSGIDVSQLECETVAQKRSSHKKFPSRLTFELIHMHEFFSGPQDRRDIAWRP